MSSGPDISAEIAPTSATDELPAPAAPKRGLSGFGLWVRVGLAVALLAASAAGRMWQARRVDEKMRSGRVAPFSLSQLPMTLGSWVGKDMPMVEIIARTTGSVDHVQRLYQNTITGQRVELIFLFGPSSEMFVHAPDVCYPATGYEHISGPLLHNLKGESEGEGPWPFFEVIYRKGEGDTADQQEVYYSWWHSGGWNPGMITQKGAERIPGMFKVQVSRLVKDQEIDVRDVGNPCEAFLAQLMPEIERRIAQSRRPS
jgi:hypothetical protein